MQQHERKQAMTDTVCWILDQMRVSVEPWWFCWERQWLTARRIYREYILLYASDDEESTARLVNRVAQVSPQENWVGKTEITRACNGWTLMDEMHCEMGMLSMSR